MKGHLPRRLQVGISLGILFVTLGVFIRFLQTHPDMVATLKQTSPWLIAGLLALYGIFTVILALIYHFTLKICGHTIQFSENVLLTAYSSIVNFFGPFQSGPGVRALYLKKKHNVSLRDYTLATLFYYAFFALFSASFLLLGSSVWWLILLVLPTIGFGCFVIIQRAIQKAIARGKKPRLVLSTPNIIGLALTTLLQVSLVAIIYFIELRAFNASITFKQAMVYSGAANFALFVSLTPGAIGFRESFLVLSNRLHGIGTPNILAASLLDRAIYIVFLAVLFVGIVITHGKRKIFMKQLRQGTS